MIDSKRKNILIVDHQLKALSHLEKILKKENFQVVVATSGLEALEKITFYKSIDIIITSAELLGMSGFRLIEKIRKVETVKNIPTIMIAGHGDVNYVMGAIIAGINDFVILPYDDHVLIEKINYLIKNNTIKKINLSHR